MVYEKGIVTKQGPSISDLEKDLNYYRTEIEVVQLKKAEAITYSLKMAVLVVAGLGLMVFADTVLFKNEKYHVLGIILTVFCIAAIGFGMLMLIGRVPMIVSQRHVDTGVMMHPAALIHDYECIIMDKEKLLVQAKEREEQLVLSSEARELEFEAERQMAAAEYGFGQNLQLGDESGISEDDDLGLTISLEDALSEIDSFTEEEEVTAE